MKTETQAIQSERKSYTPPKLISYGGVRSLTQAISAGPAEMTTGNNSDKKASDRMTKENLVKIGVHPLGIDLYLFDYKPEYRDAWGHGRQFGVMADEVERVMPEAVSMHPDGYKMVNYAMLGISRSLH